MEEHELEQIDAFLTMVGQSSLLEYYGVSPATDPAEVENRIRTQRAWAQTQQANPKFRNTALWLIKNNNLVRRVLLDELPAYVRAVAEREKRHKFSMLGVFVRGVLSDGTMTANAEAAITRQGRELGLASDEIARFLKDLGLERSEDADMMEEVSRDFPPIEADFRDYYTLLKVSPDAPQDQVEAAYRERYRWARTLKDTYRAGELYRELDEAWRSLGDPEKRKAYDRKYRQFLKARARSRRPEPDSFDPGVTSREGASGKVIAVFTQAAPRQVDQVTVVNLPGANASIPPRESPAAEPLAGTSLVSGAQTNPRLQPAQLPSAPRVARKSRLDPDLPQEMSFTYNLRPIRRTITVRNVGKGPMYATLSSNQDWLTVDPTSLEGLVDAADVTVTLEPREFSGRVGTARLAIQTTHGERHFIQFRVVKTRFWIAGVALGLAAALAGFLFAWSAGVFQAAPTGPAEPSLRVWVDPPAQAILLDGRLVGEGERVSLPNPAPAGTPFELKVQLDGFETWQEKITLQPGEEAVRRVSLQLLSPLNWRPKPEQVPTSLPVRKVEEVLATRREALDACFTRANLPAPPALATLDMTGWVNAKGRLTGVEYSNGNIPLDAVGPCLDRQLAGLQFPLLSGDFAIIQNRFQVSLGTTAEGGNVP